MAQPAPRQGLTLGNLSAQLEPCLSQEDTLHTLHTPNTPLTRASEPLRAPPIPYRALTLSQKVDACKPLLHGHGGWRRGADGSVSVEASSVSEQAATYRHGLSYIISTFPC